MNELKLSDKIKKILKVKRWSQTALAYHLKIGNSRLNDYYHDRHKPVHDWVVDEIEKLYEEVIGGKDGKQTKDN